MASTRPGLVRVVQAIRGLSSAGFHAAPLPELALNVQGQATPSFPPLHPCHGSMQGDAHSHLLAFSRRVSSAAGGSSHMAAIKELRFRTGAPIKDVKAALEAADWNLDEAMTELRKKGMAAASKKKSRRAADGLLGLAATQSGSMATVVEVNSETDFVARNDLFRCLVSSVAQAALQRASGLDSDSARGNVQELSVPELEGLEVDLNHEKLQGRRSIVEAVAEVSATTGEHVKLRRAFALAAPNPDGFVATYLHSSPLPGLGRMASLVALQGSRGEGEAQQQRAAEVGLHLAMHAVALRPASLSREDVAPDALRKERDILTAQAVASGKPAAVVEKMVEGRLKRFYSENVFLEQPLVTDDTVTVQKFLQNSAADLGPLQISSFLRVEVGEGLSAQEES